MKIHKSYIAVGMIIAFTLMFEPHCSRGRVRSSNQDHFQSTHTGPRAGIAGWHLFVQVS